MQTLSIFYNDSDDEDEDQNEEIHSAWPSMGTLLLFRVMGHIFPVTDRRHYVITPSVLLMGQMLSQTPILSMYDLVMGLMISGLLIEYTKEANRIVPEAFSFLAGVIRLYAHSDNDNESTATGDKDGISKRRYPIATFQLASRTVPALSLLRKHACAAKEPKHSTSAGDGEDYLPELSLEKSFVIHREKDASVAVLYAALDMVERAAEGLSNSVEHSEREIFKEITESLLSLEPSALTSTDSSKINNPEKQRNKKRSRLPEIIRRKITTTSSTIVKVCKIGEKRNPSRSTTERGPITMIKSLIPRIEDERHLSSRDKNKNSTQVAIDRTRREYKREHKAISRELRLDASFIENERRSVKQQKDTKAREKRQRNYAWMENEQATVNQQVRLGGGLLKGGGIGVAKAKAKTSKLGMIKGGKL